MRILLVSNLYPSAAEPSRATYNRSLVGALRELGHEVAVLAPVPWFPLVDPVFRGRRKPPAREIIDGTAIWHPSVLYTPGVFIRHHYRLYRACIRRTLRDRVGEFRPDHVLVAFAYPDGAAVVPLCRELGVSHSLAVLGSDFRVRCRQPGFRDIVRRVLLEVPLVFCPGQALKRDMVAYGIPEAKIVPFKNGVDHGVFRLPEPVVDREPKRVLFVGNLVTVKGVDRLANAWRTVSQACPEAVLELVGEGPLRGSLETELTGVTARVVFRGRLDHREVADRMRESFCLCLPSRSEGMPNVVLEAMACGLPVVATGVGEVPDLVRDGETGFVVDAVADEDGVIRGLSDALQRCLGRQWDRQAIARSVSGYTWQSAAETVVRAIRSSG